MAEASREIMGESKHGQDTCAKIALTYICEGCGERVQFDESDTWKMMEALNRLIKEVTASSIGRRGGLGHGVQAALRFATRTLERKVDGDG